jgi:broad specificity phosphatase PhoE
MARLVAGHLREQGHDVAEVTASPLERAQETAQPVAAAYALPVRTDGRLIEAENSFQGTQVTARRRGLARPGYWWRYRNPLLPSWGESYAAQHTRVLAVARDAAARVAGREAVLVSHQLPIWATRLHVQGDRLWHDPRRRECALASLTTLTFDGDALVGLAYSEPAAALAPEAHPVPGA